MTGKRMFVFNASVNQVKKALGKLVKKVQSAGNNVVEVIHTHNGTGPRQRPAIYKLISALNQFQWSYYPDKPTYGNGIDPKCLP
jgi:hypothetical protein